MAKCIPFPVVEIPPFPDGFGFGPPPLPSVDADANICCVQAAFSWSPVIPIGSGAVNIALITALNAAAAAARAWIDVLPAKCPKNGAEK